MHIAIDVREACNEQRTGKGQWTLGCVSELLTREHQLTLLTDQNIPEQWKQYHPEIVQLPSGWKWHFHAANCIRSSGCDVYLSPTSYITPWLLGKRVSCVPVVHDLIAFRNEPHDRKATLIERLLLGSVLKTAKHVLCISQSTKYDLLEQFSGISDTKLTTVYAGPFAQHPPMNSPDGRTILCPATLSPRKNQLRLMQAFASLPDDLKTQYQLLLIGSRGWNDAAIIELAEQTNGVEWRGHVADEEYERFLSTCTVLALPSLYEGFGLQVLDALQRGIPVLTSSRGSLAEVAGSAAVLVDPEDIASITEGLHQILSNTELQDRLRNEGTQQAEQFSWKRTVDVIVESLLQ